MAQQGEQLGIWIELGFWLASLVCVWAVYLANLWIVLFRKKVPNRAFFIFTAITVAVGAAVTLVELSQRLENRLSTIVEDSYRFLIPLLLIVCIGVALCSGTLVGIWRLARRPSQWGLLLGLTVLTLWITYRYFDAMRGDMTLTVEEFSTSLVPVEDVFLRTDRGRFVRVYQSLLADRASSNDDSPAIVSSGFVIRRDKPSPHYNCHGWIFTGGKYVVKSEDVELILADNGYVPVDQPSVGDIVVYYDEQGRVIHTAVVRGLLDDGTPVLESKWGFGGRFLHRPDQQVYSMDFRFYRTARPAHGSGVLAKHWLDLIRFPTQRRVVRR